MLKHVNLLLAKLLIVSLIVLFSSIGIFTQIPNLASGVKIRNISLDNQDDLLKVVFLDNKRGWVISEDGLFKTQNEGRTWRYIHVEQLSNQEKLSGISFQNSRVGNLIIQKMADGLEVKENQLKILQSTNGGISWKGTKTIKDGILQNIIFNNKGDGWIVGYRKKGYSSVGYTYLVLHSNDYGKQWNEISNQFEAQVISENNFLGNKLQRNIVLNAHVTTSSSVQLLLSNLTILDISLNGKLLSIKSDEFKNKSFGSFCCSGVTDKGNLWYALAADSVEGIFSEIVVQKNKNEFSRTTIGMNFFEDMVYLGNNKFVIAGKNFHQDNYGWKTEGIILYTNDSGISWQTLYHDKSVITFNSIAKITARDLVVVGGSGKIVRIDLSNVD